MRGVLVLFRKDGSPLTVPAICINSDNRSDDENWVTINGTHVPLDDDGNAKGGGKLKGMNFSRAKSQKKSPQAKENHETQEKRSEQSHTASSRIEVSGEDISASYTGERDIKSVLQAQGFDGLPKVVGQDEFDNAVQESGFVAQRTYVASSQEVLDAYRDMLYDGEWYVDCSVGGAQYGQGMYCAADYSGKITPGIESEMSHYQKLGQERAVHEVMFDLAGRVTKDDFDRNPYSKRVGVTEDEARVFAKLKSDPNMTGWKLPDDEQEIWQGALRNNHWRSMCLALSDMQEKAMSSYTAPSFTETMTLAKGAKVVKYSDIVSMKESDSVYRTAEIDIGAYAAMRGYDAINAEGHGESGSYTVILNRTKTVILDGRGRNDEADGSTIIFQNGEDGMVYAIRGGKVIGWVKASDGSN